MKRDNRGYYDIDITLDEILTSGGMVEELFYLKDLKQRKLFLDTDVEQISAGNIAKHIMQYNAEDKGKSIEERKPIILYVASNGGEIDAGFELIDVIRGSKTRCTRSISDISIAWDSLSGLQGISGLQFRMRSSLCMMVRTSFGIQGRKHRTRWNSRRK